jgi:hypothetical protein
MPRNCVFGKYRAAATKLLLFQSLPQTLQRSEFVVFAVKRYPEFASYSEFPATPLLPLVVGLLREAD